MKNKLVLRKILLFILVLFIFITPSYFILKGYMDSRPKLQYSFNEYNTSNIVTYPDTQFVILSDIHYYDKSLGTSGEAFEKALKSDRKLLLESEELLNLAINNIIKSDAKFVLIPGDLTKDGELVNHLKVSEALNKLIQNGKKVFVVPGNHDYNNPGAFKYENDKEIPIPSVSEKKFEEIYKNFGYDKAIYRDKNTLSYVAEVSDNIWLIAIDSTRSRENKPGSNEIVSGKLIQGQEIWLEDVLKKSRDNKKAVIFMEHHGVVEHWKGQSKLHPDYLIEDYKYIGKLLSSYNVRLAFTGHYHAQDITRSDFDKAGFIYDIETGSLITSPCPIRFCSIKNNKLNIESMDLVMKFKPETEFAKDALNFVHTTIKSEAYDVLRKYYVSEKDANYISEYVSYAFIAHYTGDEDVNNKPELDKSKLSLWSKIVFSQQKYIIEGLWKDINTKDNKVILELSY